MKPAESVRLPLNFDRRADVTLFTRATGRMDLAFLLWLEWANERRDWRALKASDEGAVDWAVEDLTYVIAAFAGERDGFDAVMAAAVDAGMLRFERRNDRLGVVLADFALHNADLLPTYQTPAQRGGAGKAVKRGREEAAKLARKQVRLEQVRQDDLILPDGMTRDQREAAIALVIRLDRACGLPSRGEFPAELVGDAAAALANTESDTIDAVLTWLIGQRENPEVPTRTDRVLRQWREIVTQACPPMVSE